MKFKSVALLGAGAVGAYLIWGLSGKQDLDFCVVAEGERKQRLEKDGLLINGVEYHPAVKTAEEARGVDLLIVTLKYHDFNASQEMIRTIADEHTIVISFMNGVEKEETMTKTLGSDANIVYALIKVAAHRVGREISFNPETTKGMIYGEKDPSRGTERTDALDELFEGTGLHYRATDIIMSEIWAKFKLNVMNNQAQAVINCGVGAYRDSEHVVFIRDRLRDEVEQIAAARGIDLNAVPASSGSGSPVKDTARYSTLQDLDAKRHTEVDMFAGAIVRMGRELGIPTPYNEYTLHAIKALEEKNDGKFDY